MHATAHGRSMAQGCMTTVAACPSCPRSRPSAAGSRRRWKDAARARRDRGRAADAAARPGRGGARARRRARPGGRSSRQVSDCSVRVGSCSPDPPPDDGVAASRTGGTAAGRSLPPRCCHARRRIGRRLPRRPAVRHVAPARAVRGGQRTSTRASAASRSTTAYRARDLAERLRQAAGAGQGGDPRPAHGRRRREHLRRRGALARAHPPADAGARRSTADEVRALHRGIRRALEAGIARQGSTLRDYALPDGSRGGDAGRVQGLRPRRASRASAAGRRSTRSAPPAAARGTAPAARCSQRAGSYAAPGRYAASSSSSRPSRSSRQSSV